MALSCDSRDLLAGFSLLEKDAIVRLAEHFSFLGSVVEEDEFGLLGISPAVFAGLSGRGLCSHRESSYGQRAHYQIDPVVVRLAKEFKLQDLRRSAPRSDVAVSRHSVDTLLAGLSLSVAVAGVICWYLAK